MYGLKSPTDTNFASHVPAYCTNHELVLQRYYTVYTPKGGSCGFPPFCHLTSEFNAVETTGTTILEMDYAFNRAPLTESHDIVTGQTCYEDTGIVNTCIGTEHVDLQVMQSNRSLLDSEAPQLSATLSYETTQEGAVAKNAKIADMVYYKFPMEQSGVFQNIPGFVSDVSVQPSIHVGIKAVPQLSTSTNNVVATEWADTQVYWCVEASLHC
ncbi:hypothetical protein HHI36_011433, partial [Cryptolaemus montrouzieri]